MGKQQVVITAVPTEAVSFVKSLRLIADLGLGDAKNLSYYLAASLPCVLVAGVDQEVRDHILSLLQEAGAGAKIEDSSLRSTDVALPGGEREISLELVGQSRDRRVTLSRDFQ